MARVYREGLEAMRRDFTRKLELARDRERALRNEAGGLYGKARRDTLERIDEKLRRPIEDLDGLREAERKLADYELVLRATKEEVEAERDRLRREQLRVKALKLLSVASLGLGAIAVGLWWAEDGRVQEAMAAEDRKCREADRCADEGLCTRERGKAMRSCIAATNDDCRSSAACRREGRCVAEDGTCSVAADEDCASSLGCYVFGACAASWRTCEATPATCRESLACRELGLCHEEYGACVAKPKATAASDDACRDAMRCMYHGQCTTTEEGCRATNPADCTSSTGCGEKGRCRLVGDRCVVSDAGCMRSQVCAFSGQCRADATSNTCVDGDPILP